MNHKNDTFKMIVLGSYGVGKTSLVDRLVFNEFKFNETTIGASFNNIRFTPPSYKGPDGNFFCNLNIWDTAGQERYRSISQIYFKDVDIAFMVYNMNNLESLSDIDSYWLENFYKNHYLDDKGASNLILYIIGNFADVYYDDRQLPVNIKQDADCQYILDKIALTFPNIKFFEVSAKSGYGIQRLYESIFEDLNLKFERLHAPHPPDSEEDYFLDSAPQKIGNKCC